MSPGHSSSHMLDASMLAIGTLLMSGDENLCPEQISGFRFMFMLEDVVLRPGLWPSLMMK